MKNRNLGKNLAQYQAMNPKREKHTIRGLINLDFENGPFNPNKVFNLYTGEDAAESECIVCGRRHQSDVIYFDKQEYFYAICGIAVTVFELLISSLPEHIACVYLASRSKDGLNDSIVFEYDVEVSSEWVDGLIQLHQTKIINGKKGNKLSRNLLVNQFFSYLIIGCRTENILEDLISETMRRAHHLKDFIIIEE